MSAAKRSQGHAQKIKHTYTNIYPQFTQYTLAIKTEIDIFVMRLC
ncbi:MAG: hypothetical protein NZ455_05105 [Bacteroidia bacterium]|nr:hypothetical protein [Bacteroidia bacterium]MDW8348420.1 hypothetical protein [Bacteroidia bacterium]